ncbi:MAG: hypothetical protein SNJ29_14230 [Rikenellaceae bacterium]
MEKITFLPDGAEAGISAIIRKATFSMHNLMSVIGKHNLSTTIEQATKVLARPTYLRDDKVAEAEAYAKHTKAPDTMSENIVRDAYNSIDPAIVQDLQRMADNWNDTFTPQDFELNEFGAWVLSAEVVEKINDSHRVSIEGDELALAHRLQAFLTEYLDICKVFDVHSLGYFKNEFEAGPTLESLCDSVVFARNFKEAQGAFYAKTKEREAQREERRRAKIKEAEAV